MQLLTQYLPHSCWYRGYFAAVNTISSTQLLLQRILCSCWHNIIYLAANSQSKYTKSFTQLLIQRILCKSWRNIFFPAADTETTLQLLTQHILSSSWYKGYTYFETDEKKNVLPNCWYTDNLQQLTQHHLPSSWYKGYFATDLTTSFTQQFIQRTLWNGWNKFLYPAADTEDPLQFWTHLLSSWCYEGYFTTVDTTHFSQLLIQMIHCICWHSIFYPAVIIAVPLRCWHISTQKLVQRILWNLFNKFSTQLLTQRILCNCWHSIFYLAAKIAVTWKMLKHTYSTQHLLQRLLRSSGSYAACSWKM